MDNKDDKNDTKWWKEEDNTLNYEKDTITLSNDNLLNTVGNNLSIKQTSADVKENSHLKILLKIRENPAKDQLESVSHGLDYIYFHAATKNKKNPPPKPKPEEIACSFNEGSFGMKISEQADGKDIYVEVESIEPGGQAGQLKKVKPLDRIKSVGDTNVKGLNFGLVVESLKSAPRPVVLTFVRPLNKDVFADPFTVLDTDMLHFLKTIASASTEPIKSKANALLEATADQWQIRQKAELYYGKDTRLFQEVKEVFDCLREIYCIEQIGRKPSGKKAFEIHIQEKLQDMYTNEDWYGIDPDHIYDDDNIARLSQNKGHSTLSFALLLTFYSNASDINTGNCTYLHFLKLLPFCKPYRFYDEIAKHGESNVAEIYDQQLNLIFTIILTLSNFGDLQLSKELFPDEYKFLNNKNVIKYATDQIINNSNSDNNNNNSNTLDQISQILICLRIFGMNETTNVAFKKCVKQIMNLQQNDGSFATMALVTNNGVTKEPITSLSLLPKQFLTNSRVIAALCPRSFRGYGPCIPGSLSILRKFITNNKKKEKTINSKTGFKMSLSANGENATTLSSQNAVLQLYPKAADITSSNSIKMPIKRKASLRLDKLLEFKRKKQAMTPSQWNKYKKAGGYENMRGLGLEKSKYFQLCKKLTGRMKSLHNFSRKLEKYHINNGGANVNAIITSIDFDEVIVEHGGSEINLFHLFKQVGAEGGMYVDRLDEFWNKQSYKLEVLGGVTNRGAVLRKLYERYLEGFERMIVSQGLK